MKRSQGNSLPHCEEPEGEEKNAWSRQKTLQGAEIPRFIRTKLRSPSSQDSLK
jgi:hypothetical protein